MGIIDGEFRIQGRIGRTFNKGQELIALEEAFRIQEGEIIFGLNRTLKFKLKRAFIEYEIFWKTYIQLIDIQI